MKVTGEDFLRIAFAAGAVTDAGALLPMLLPQIADLLWGFRDTSEHYRFATGYGAALMLGWVGLLIWGYRRPVERRFIAVLTVIVICGLMLTEIIAVRSGTLNMWRMVPTWRLQVLLIALFALAYFRSRRASHRDLSRCN